MARDVLSSLLGSGAPPYRNKLTHFGIMFVNKPPLIPAKGRMQAIEMSNYSFLKSLQAMKVDTTIKTRVKNGG